MEREKTFYDVEHGGDIEHCLGKMRNAGAKVLGWKHNYDAEQLLVRFELPSDSKEVVNQFYDNLKREENE